MRLQITELPKIDVTSIMQSHARAQGIDMNKPLDELLLILGLVHLVATQVTAAQERLSKFEELTRGLAEVTLDEVEPDEEPESSKYDDTLVADLEARKLDLVMAIQKQQYLSDKIDEIVGQNQDIVDTVREYFQLRDQITIEEREYAQRKLKYYQIISVEPAIEYMDKSNCHLVQNMKSARHAVESATKQFSQNVNEMNGEYNLQGLELIKEMNSIFRQIEECPTERGASRDVSTSNQEKRDLLILPLDRPLSIGSIPSPTISLNSLESSDSIGVSPNMPYSLPENVSLKDNQTRNQENSSINTPTNKAPRKNPFRSDNATIPN